MAERYRLVYCRHDDCRIGFPVARTRPRVCPGCERAADWTPDPPTTPSPHPAIAWALSIADRRLLRSLRIDPELPDTLNPLP